MLKRIMSFQKQLRVKIGKGQDRLENLTEQQKGEKLYHLIQATRQELAELQDEVYWKWWSKENQETPFSFKNKENAKIEAIDMLHFMLDIFVCLDMNDEDVYNLYFMKWKKNMERQDKNYSVVNKTEDDNIEIQEQLKRSIR